ncbi:MAG: DegT/DnrJ/EryC1/StrS family aminotransferase [Oscillospiraceae bacterium]
MNIPFSPPDITEAEISEVCDALRSGWITTGPRTKEFERQIAAYVGTKKAVCLNSGTAGMELTLRLLGVGEGDEVIVPAYTYSASCSVICHVGATPVMIDVAEDSFELDYASLAAHITDRTKVIIPVDIAGITCDYDRIYQAVEEKRSLFRPANELQKLYGRVIVMADCAHGFGAERNGVKAGALADFTSYSFHAVKNLTTAEGGAVTWRSLPGLDDEAVYREYQLFSLHGQTKDALNKNKLGAWEYDIVAPYYKCNMPDIMAAIGLMQLKRYGEMIDRRFQIIRRYNDAFSGLNVTLLNHEDAHHRSSGHLYLVRVNGIDAEQRNGIITRMAEQGIACNVHYKPLPMLTAYKNLGFNMEDYPHAYAQYVNEITLPLYSTLTDEQVEYIIEKFTEIVEAYS